MRELRQNSNIKRTSVGKYHRWSFRYNWSLARRRYSNYIFTPDINGLRQRQLQDKTGIIVSLGSWCGLYRWFYGYLDDTTTEKLLENKVDELVAYVYILIITLESQRQSRFACFYVAFLTRGFNNPQTDYHTVGKSVKMTSILYP